MVSRTKEEPLRVGYTAWVGGEGTKGEMTKRGYHITVHVGLNSVPVGQGGIRQTRVECRPAPQVPSGPCIPGFDLLTATITKTFMQQRVGGRKGCEQQTLPCHGLEVRQGRVR